MDLLGIKSYIELTKPRISLMTVLTALVGGALANSNQPVIRWVLMSVSVFFIVGAANSLNMAYESEEDQLMERTKNRPIASGRLKKMNSIYFGIILGLVSLILLYSFFNLTTALIALFSLLIYVFIYTPLKYKTPYAILIGAIPGAAPPLIGYLSYSDSLNLGCLSIFTLLYFWQIPHFLSIAFIRKDEYSSAGIRAFPVVYESEYIIRLFSYSCFLMLIPSFLFYYLDQFNLIHFLLSFIPVVGFVYFAIKLFTHSEKLKYFVNIYHYSIIYLPIYMILIFSNLIFK